VRQELCRSWRKARLLVQATCVHNGSPFPRVGQCRGKRTNVGQAVQRRKLCYIVVARRQHQVVHQFAQLTDTSIWPMSLPTVGDEVLNSWFDCVPPSNVCRD